MRYTGIQPQYFPRLHYFARILNTDIFVIRDEVQFVSKHKYPDGRTDKSYQAHTPIKTPSGRFLLTVQITHHGYQPLRYTRVSFESDWVPSLLTTLRYNYSRAPHFNEVFSDIQMILASRPRSLARLNTMTILWGILKFLSVENITLRHLDLPVVSRLLKKRHPFRLRTIRMASELLPLNRSQNMSANEKIVALIRKVGAGEDYCGGTAHQAYMDENIFSSNGIRVTVQDWKCREYPQLFVKPAGFVPNLSIIDLLMNVSPKEAVSILQG